MLQQIFVVLLLLHVLCTSFGLSYKMGNRNITFTMHTPQSRRLISDEASKSLRIRYKAIFPKTACCPGLHISPEDDINDMNDQSQGTYFPDIENLLGLNQYYSLLDPTYDDHVVCKEIGEHSVCEGRKDLSHAADTFWYLTLGYKSDVYNSFSTKPTIQFQYEEDSETVGHCVSFRGNFHFSNSRNQTSLPVGIYTPDSQVYLPNILGLPSVSNLASRYMDGLLLNDCHQHLKTFLHLTLYPACNLTNGDLLGPVQLEPNNSENPVVPTGASQQTTLIGPCKKFCLEVYSACSCVAGILQNEGCNIYPTRDCFYIPVKCPSPPQLEQAAVHVINGTQVTYKCVNGSILKGDGTIHCLPSGQWSGVKFSCETQNVLYYSLHQSTLIAIYVTIVVVLAIFGAVLCYHRKLLMFIIQVYMCKKVSSLKKAISAGVSDKPQVFLSYSSLDNDRVQILKSELKSKISECQILSYEEDFVIGQRIVDCIRDAVWHSQAAILFLTENYLDSEWCDFEFHEAHLRYMSDRGFRVVIVVDQQVSKLKGMSEELQLYLKSHIYLQWGDPHFWSRLRNTLLS